MSMSTRGHDSTLRAVFETAVDGVILINGSGIVQMFNPACEKLFGYRAEEVIGQNVKMLMPEPYHSGHDKYLENYQQTGHRKIIGIGREVVGRCKDGSTFAMDLSVGEAEHDGASMFVGVIHDLRAHHAAAQALRESESQLRAVLTTAVDGIILIDASGIVEMFNPACERLFGYTAEEVIGRNVKMLMPIPFRDEHDTYLANYHRTHDAKIIGIGREVIGRRKDGSKFPMNLSVGEAKQDQGSMFVGIIHDLSDRKKTEEQLVQAQKMEAVGQLSGGIAHDFNNLLTVIIGNAQILNERLQVRQDLQRLAAMIQAAGERGAELTRRLLAFSRRQTLQPTATDCNKLIRGMKNILRRTLREDIAIVLALDTNLKPAFADHAQLESAILNLAINARDAMPNGGRLTIATAAMPLDQTYSEQHPEVKPGNYVMIAITDDGTGMPPDVLARVFEPFYTTKEVGKGSGLGLSMVYGFIKQSNGHVSIYSEVGLGTTVRLYLPMTSNGIEAPISSNSIGEVLQRGTETVLVAEDDPFVRAYAVECLGMLGYRVIAAGDGHKALVVLEANPEVSLLFTDIVMPGGLSGWELAEAALRLKPTLKLLFTSGYALETLEARGKVHADWGILNKPYRKEDLARQIRKALDT